MTRKLTFAMYGTAIALTIWWCERVLAGLTFNWVAGT